MVLHEERGAPVGEAGDADPLRGQEAVALGAPGRAALPGGERLAGERREAQLSVLPWA